MERPTLCPDSTGHPLRKAALFSALLILSCVRTLPSWYSHQDTGIQMPVFHEGEEQRLDGLALQALRVAAEDFLPASREATSCAETLAAYEFQIIRRSELIFVRIAPNRTACGGQVHGLDGAARYAINTDGQILRRLLDTEPEGNAGEDGGVPSHPVEVLPTSVDGGTPRLDMGVDVNGPYTPPWRRDAGTSAP